MPFPDPTLTPPVLAPYQMSFGGVAFGGIDRSSAYQLQSLTGIDMPDTNTGDQQRPLDQGEFAGLDVLKGRDITLQQVVRSASTAAVPHPYAAAILATPNLLAYWRLNEVLGLTTATDQLGANPGSYQGSTVGYTNDLTNPSVETDLTGWVLTQAAMYSTTVLADSPIDYWRLNETSGTSAASGGSGAHAGTYTGTYTLAQAGATGDGDKAVLLGGGGVTTTTTPFVVGAQTTIEGFAYSTSSPASTQLFGSSSPGGPLLYFASATNLSFYPQNVGAVTWAAAWPGNNQWVHWALTFDDTTHVAELFINGVSQGQKTGAQSLTAPANFQMGMGAGGGAFPGYMDEVATWTSIVSSVRIAAHYAARAATSSITQSSAWAAAGTKSLRFQAVTISGTQPTVDCPSFAVPALATISGRLAYNAATISGGNIPIAFHWSDGTSSTALATVTGAGIGNATIAGVTVPAGVTSATIRLAPSAAGTYDISVDAALKVNGSVLPAYFDGNTPGCSWTATPNNSTSTSPAGYTLGVTGPTAETASTAVKLGGTDGYVTVPNSSVLQAIVPLSIEAFVNPVAFTTAQAIVSKGTGATPDYEWRLNTTGKQELLIGGTLVATSTAALTAGSYNAIAVTYDGAHVVFYLAGVADGSTAVTQYVPRSSGALTIGRRADGTEPAGITIGEVSLYGRAITPSEVSTHRAAALVAPSVASSVTVDQARQKLAGVLGVAGAVEQPLYLQLPSGLFACMARPRRHSLTLDSNTLIASGCVATTLFHATDPRWYAVPAKTATVGLPTPVGGLGFPVTFPASFGGGGVGGLVTVTNAGLFEMRPVFVITGPCTNPAITNLSITGSPTIGFTISLAAGDQLIVDTDFQTIIYIAAGTTAGSSRRNTLTPTSRWFNLPPGANQIEFTTSDGTQVAGTLTVKTADAYLAL